MTGWWWWVDLPRALGRRFVGLSAIAVDGHVLLGLGPLAGLLPVTALLAGGYVGAEHPGFEITFTESLTLMLVMVAVGTISTQLGALATLGFACGDFFVNHTQWTTKSAFGFGFGDQPSFPLSNPVLANLIVVRTPLLIQYALLAALAIGLPIGARGLAGSVAQRLQLPDGVHFVVSAALVAVTAFVLGRLWAAAAPMVIRPVFTWTIDDGINKGLVPIEAIAPIQENVQDIARAAALAVLGRAALTWVLGRARPGPIRRAEQAILAPIEGQRTTPGPVRALLQAALVAFVAVLLLAGLIDDLWAAGVLAGAFFLSRLARSGMIPLPTRRWREVVNRVPVLFRYGATLLVMNGIAKAVIASSLNTTDDRFQFLIWPVAGAALLMAFLMPDPPPEPVPADETPPR
jgi:hypothetical protein